MIKTTKMILMLAILLVAGMPMCLASENVSTGDVTVIIKDEKGTPVPSTRPRMPAYRSLTCVYDTDTAVLTVSWNRGCDNVVFDNVWLYDII